MHISGLANKGRERDPNQSSYGCVEIDSHDHDHIRLSIWLIAIESPIE